MGRAGEVKKLKVSKKNTNIFSVSKWVEELENGCLFLDSGIFEPNMLDMEHF